jgi:hypothetical protein
MLIEVMYHVWRIALDDPLFCRIIKLVLSVAGDRGVLGGAVEHRESLLSTPISRCTYICF